MLAMAIRRIQGDLGGGGSGQSGDSEVPTDVSLGATSSGTSERPRRLRAEARTGASELDGGLCSDCTILTHFRRLAVTRAEGQACPCGS